MYFYNKANSDIDLVSGGQEIPVTLDNLQEYIDASIDSTLNKTVNLQLNAFKKGFCCILPIEALRSFRTKGDLDLLICGQNPNSYDKEWEDATFLKTIITPDQGYSQESDQYNFFVRYISELEPINRRVFTSFITGSCRLPMGGFAALHPRITLVPRNTNSEKPDHDLVTVSTCVHYVKMPAYSSYEVMKR